MAKISLYTVKERSEHGLWNGLTTSHETVPSPSHGSRAERFQQIIKFVGENPGCTRLEIARSIGIKKSPHFVGMLDELIQDGHLLSDVDTMPNGMNVYLYRVRE